MNKKLISIAIAAAVAAPLAAQAGTITVPNMDITMSGGITGDYMYQTDTKMDEYVVNDALLDFASDAKADGVGFKLGVGTLANNDLHSSSSTTGVIGNGGNVGVQYGWVTVMPTDGLTIDAGKLATNTGYEVAPSYDNGNILRGLVYYNQAPNYYTGARVTYSTGGMSVYVEGSKQPAGGNSNGQAIGASATMGSVNGSIHYFNDEDNRSIVDIVASSQVGSATIAANIDYQTKAKRMKTAGTDDNAYGIALYATVPMGDMAELPMRLEYVNDGTSGLYGLGSSGNSNTAITFTITPTYNFSKATFVRAELAYVTTDKKTAAYVDDKGIATDSNLTVGAQAGVRF
jgi:predicted porin